VKTENPSACVTVNLKCVDQQSRCITSSPELCVNKLSINTIIQSKTRLISHARTPTRDDALVHPNVIYC
jgi:hypothetical protein